MASPSAESCTSSSMPYPAEYAARNAASEFSGAPPGLHPTVRGVVAVLLNPGAYVFLATTGAAVVADAAHDGGRALAFVTVGALLAGVSLMDSSMVLLGSGAHRVNDRILRMLGDVLALALGALGIWLIVQGAFG